jgi:DNA polymerase epsilon subunit 2
MQINSKVKIRKFIHNLFTKKYGLVVQSDAAKYLEQLLAREPDIADTIERIVKTYKKRYNGIVFTCT